MMYLLSFFSLFASFHISYEYGINAPLQSRNDMVRMAPFSLNIVTPTRDTTTGCENLWSLSGRLKGMVNTDPKLVPTHNVGQSIVGSTENLY